MTKRRFAVAVLVLLAVPAIWSWWSSDRRRIGRQVDELQDLVSKSGPETGLAGLATARAITGLFASSFEVRAQQLGFSTRDRSELARFIHGYRSAADSIRMQVTGSSLSISTEHRRATLNAAFEFPTGGPLGSADERYRVQVNWLEEDGRWLIDYVDLVEIVGRAGGF